MDKAALPLPAPDSWLHDWVGVGIILLASLLVAGLIAWWYKHRHAARKRKRKRNSERRKLNPTLDQAGGLPPPRDPNEPPRLL